MNLKNLFSQILNQRDEIDNEILRLRNYVVREHHITLPKALEQARMYLNEIKSHDNSLIYMQESWKCAWENFQFYENAMNAVQDQQVTLEIFWRDFKKTHSRITDGMQQVDKTFEILKNTSDILEHISNYKMNLIEDHKIIFELRDGIRQFLNHSLIPNSDVRLEMIENGNDEIETVLENIEKLRGILNETLNEDMDRRRDLKKHWVPKASRHAENLMRRSSDYVKKFQTTKDAARMALLARLVSYFFLKELCNYFMT